VLLVSGPVKRTDLLGGAQLVHIAAVAHQSLNKFQVATSRSEE
jgi:hypothetical protein